MPRRNQRAFNVSYYLRNRDAEIARVRRRQNATVEWLRALRAVPCLDCGGMFPPHVMDFDHRDPAQKSFQLSAPRALLKPRRELLAEIAKCDVICANCHRIRTAAAYASGLLAHGFKPAAEPHPDRTAQGRRERFRRLRQGQNELLDRIRALPCADCRRTYPTCVMEFDHREPSLKLGMLSVMAGRVRIRTLLEEIAKCDIVCSNCHRDRSFRRRFDNAGVAQLARATAFQAVGRGFETRLPLSSVERPHVVEDPAIPYRYAA